MVVQTIKIAVDASAAAKQLGDVLQIGNCSRDLESAISSTVTLLAGEPGKWLFDRLSVHLDFLLAEQRAMASGWRVFANQGVGNGAP